MTNFQLPTAFFGTRCRFQRLSDARFFHGWLITQIDGGVVVKSHQIDLLEPGDQFFYQMFGDGESVMGKMEFATKSGQELRFKLIEKPTVIASSEAVRVLVNDLKVSVKLGWFEAIGDVFDVSHNGVGISLPTAVELGEVLKLSMFTMFGDVRARGEVCYCRMIDGLHGFYRVGVEFYPMDTLMKTKWNRLIESSLRQDKAA